MALTIFITAIISLILGFGACALFSGKRITELEKELTVAYRTLKKGKGIVEVEE